MSFLWSSKSGPKIKYVKETGPPFGNGYIKKAFHIKVEEPFWDKENYFTIPKEKDAADFCLVKFDSGSDRFKSFDIENTLDFLTELEEMHKLSELDLAPKLHLIRIDKTNVSGENVREGIPFPPTQLDTEKKIISDIKPTLKDSYRHYFNISFLVEMCGETVDVFLTKNNKNNSEPNKLVQVGEKFNDFTTKLLADTGAANMDLKPANMCAKYDKTTGEIESIRLLDVDPKFSFTSENPEFQKHAKIFMNFLFFSFCLKYRKIKFPNWYLTKDEVREMIRFFFAEEFLKNDKYPIGMLYHYLTPRYLKLHFSLEDANSKKSIISVFEEYINAIPEGREESKHREEESKYREEEESKYREEEESKHREEESKHSKGGKRKSKRRKNNKRKRTRKM